MPTNGPPLPDPKARTLARGPRRYRRKVASPKQWQAIQAAKTGPCRVCGAAASNGHVYGKIHLHHVVARDHFGDDVPANIVPLCPECHRLVTYRSERESRALLASLTGEELSYMLERGGADYAQRGYGVRYAR